MPARPAIIGLEGEIGPLCAALLDYWLERRGERPMPARVDLDPIDIPKLLPHIMLMDVLPGTGRMRFRLVGTRVVVMFGADNTGRYLDEVDFGEQRPAILESYDLALAHASPHHRRMGFINKDGVKFDMERLILPLSSDGGRHVDMLISLLDIQENIAG